ncbi:hypothetical protein CDL15_Pgr024121 [Punica granatum]|uniref:Uncharacterized protein n=1 Tax=Punica granatum TaxID=22663 RepID=A0A218XWM1_PUNGR|nr:hypothetical protein CDL15_Pgr024121 [Punica granatum]
MLTQKAENEEPTKSSLLPPYVHPLGKKSASSLSSKSLEVCTESLGSETGSEKFFPSSSSELECTIRQEGEDLDAGEANGRCSPRRSSRPTLSIS